jgi:hypothetical protein
MAAARAADAARAGDGRRIVPRLSDTLIVDGHAFSWKRLCELRRDQLEAARKAEAAQLSVFEAQKDWRPAAERSAAGRYLQPGLLELIHR